MKWFVITTSVLTAVAVGTAVICTNVFADNGRNDAIDEPGLFSFYHPMQDVLNGGDPPMLMGRLQSSAMMKVTAPRMHTRIVHTAKIKNKALVKTAAR